MDHFANIKKAFELTWKYKFLWVFGFVVTFFGQAPTFNNNINISEDNPSRVNEIINPLISWWNSMNPTLHLVVIIGSVFFFLAFSILIMYLVARSEAALVGSVTDLNDGKHVNLAKAWKLGGPKAWNLIGQKLLLNLPLTLLGLILMVISVLVFLGTFKSDLSNISDFFTSPLSLVLLLCTCLFAIVALIYSLLTGILYTFSSRISVIHDKGIITSIKLSYAFVKKNLSELVMSWLFNLIVMIPVSIVVGIVSFIIMLILFIPVFLALMTLMLTNIFLFIAAIILLGLIAQFFGSMIGGFFSAFGSAYWTIVYTSLDKK
jgi:hypothetical protein